MPSTGPSFRFGDSRTTPRACISSPWRILAGDGDARRSVTGEGCHDDRTGAGVLGVNEGVLAGRPGPQRIGPPSAAPPRRPRRAQLKPPFRLAWASFQGGAPRRRSRAGRRRRGRLRRNPPGRPLRPRRRNRRAKGRYQAWAAFRDASPSSTASSWPAPPTVASRRRCQQTGKPRWAALLSPGGFSASPTLADGLPSSAAGRAIFAAELADGTAGRARPPPRPVPADGGLRRWPRLLHVRGPARPLLGRPDLWVPKTSSAARIDAKRAGERRHAERR